MPIGDHPAPGGLWVVQFVVFLLIYLTPVAYMGLFARQASRGGRKVLLPEYVGSVASLMTEASAFG